MLAGVRYDLARPPIALRCPDGIEITRLSALEVEAALSSTSAIGFQHQSLHAEAAIDCHDFQLAAKLGADADENSEPSRLSARIPLPTQSQSQ